MRSAGLIGQQPDSLASQRRESIRPEYVDALSYVTNADGAREGRSRKLGRGIVLRAPSISWHGGGEFRGHDRRHLGSHRRRITLAIGVHPVGEQHDIRSTDWIDPDRRTGKARMTERSYRIQVAAIGGVTAVDVPTEPALHVHGWRSCRRGHASHTRGRQHTLPIDFAAAQQHACVSREIFGRTKQTSMARHPTHAASRRIVHDALQQYLIRSIAGPSVGGTELRWCDDTASRRSRQDPRGCHTHRIENALLHKSLQRLTRQSRDDLTEDDVTDVAVDKSLAWCRLRKFVDGSFNRFVGSQPIATQIETRPQS